jgi:hypothetical protein
MMPMVAVMPMQSVLGLALGSSLCPCLYVLQGSIFASNQCVAED